MKLNNYPGMSLHVVLWVGTAIILLTMLFFNYRQKVAEENLLKNLTTKFESSSGTVINELLLSGDEMSITEKTSFINILLKSAGNEESVTESSDNSGKIYKLILRQKLNRMKQKKTEDFYVKPITK